MAFEHLDQPSWDRVFAQNFAAWDARLALLSDADEELRLTQHRARRLQALDQDIAHWTRMRDEARRELVDLKRRRQAAVDKAVEEAGQKALIGRAKRMEAARAWAEELQEEQFSGPIRVAQSRMSGAQRELDQRQEELREIGTHPVYRNPEMLAWLEKVHELVAATTKRDGRARDLIRTPWQQRQAIDEALLRRLRTTVGDSMVMGAAYGQGSIHVIGGGQLAVVEFREGTHELRATGDRDTRRLLQLADGGERPAGATTGDLEGLRAAVGLVERVTGARAQGIICLHGWKAKPAKVDEVILCGPAHLDDILHALPPRTVLPNDLEAIAGAIATLPTPHIPVPTPAALDAFGSVDAQSVPSVLAAVRTLLAEAQSTHEIDLREAVGARG